MIDGRGSVSLFEENASEHTSRLGNVSFECHRQFCVTPRVSQTILLFVQPREIHVRGGISLRSRQCRLERPPGTAVISERQPADADIHEEPGQTVVQSGRSLEGGQRLVVPALLLQGESAQLVPQGLPFARTSELLRDGVSAPVAAARVCPAEREQDRGLVGPGLRAGFQMRDCFSVFACFYEHESEELPGLQE